MSSPSEAPPPPFDIPAGWYEDPRTDRHYRYWDGAGWTDQVVPATDGRGRRPAAEPRKVRWDRLLVWIPIAALAAALVALVLLEDANQPITDPVAQLDLQSKLGGTFPGVSIQEFEDGFTGHPGGLNIGSDGNLWFSEQFDDKIGVFDLATKTAHEYDVPKGTRPHNTYTGPDGNIWFTGLNDNIGVFDIKTKKATVFTKGISTGAEPHVIITDPTNNRYMWFTEQNGSRIARFDRETEKIVEFDLPNNTLPHGIVPDPNRKAIWWAEQGPDALGTLDLSDGPIESQQDFDQHYKHIPGLPKGSGPHDPLFGPAGKIYMTLQDSNELGRFDPKTGKYETFPTGLPPFPGREVVENRAVQNIESAADPDSLRSFYTLTASKDGKYVFFNAAIQNAVCIFDVGKKRVFLQSKGISAQGAPLFVVRGPDNAIWFTEPGIDPNLPGRIGRLTIE